jgi:hypothetical protein
MFPCFHSVQAQVNDPKYRPELCLVLAPLRGGCQRPHTVTVELNAPMPEHFRATSTLDACQSTTRWFRENIVAFILVPIWHSPRNALPVGYTIQMPQ